MALLDQASHRVQGNKGKYHRFSGFWTLKQRYLTVLGGQEWCQPSLKHGVSGGVVK